MFAWIEFDHIKPKDGEYIFRLTLLKDGRLSGPTIGRHYQADIDEGDICPPLLWRPIDWPDKTTIDSIINRRLARLGMNRADLTARETGMINVCLSEQLGF